MFLIIFLELGDPNVKEIFGKGGCGNWEDWGGLGVFEKFLAGLS
jgi:hypothetical protein